MTDLTYKHLHTTSNLRSIFRQWLGQHFPWRRRLNMRPYTNRMHWLWLDLTFTWLDFDLNRLRMHWLLKACCWLSAQSSSSGFVASIQALVPIRFFGWSLNTSLLIMVHTAAYRLCPIGCVLTPLFHWGKVWSCLLVFELDEVDTRMIYEVVLDYMKQEASTDETGKIRLRWKNCFFPN